MPQIKIPDKKKPKVRLSVTIDKDLLQDLARISKSHELLLSNLVNEILKDWVIDYFKQHPQKKGGRK